jgi:hypothetical protein
MRNEAALLLLIISFSIGATPFIEAQAQVIPSPEVFTEAYLEQVPVSGSILTGLQYSTPSDSAGKNLWVRIPQAAIGKLCISVITDDGRYSAAAQFSLSALTSGEHSLPYPTKYGQQLRKYTAGRTALLASIADACTSPRESLPTYLPISWSPPADANKLLVLVNSGDSDVRLYRNSTKMFSPCNKVQMNAARVAYDTICSVDVVSADSNWIGSIIRNRNDETLPFVPLQVSLR